MALFIKIIGEAGKTALHYKALGFSHGMKGQYFFPSVLKSASPWRNPLSWLKPKTFTLGFLTTILWLGFSIYLTTMSIKSNQQEFLTITFPFLLTMIFFLFYGFGRWVSRDDRYFISERIKSSINDDLNT